jgi:type IV pilus assembly protein PilN
MNIKINLLPPSARKDELPLKKMLAILTVCLILVLSVVYTYGVYTAWQLEHQLSDTRNQFELLRPTRDKMAAANSKQQQINAKNNLLIALTKERNSWYAVLTHLGAITPPQIWLTELTVAEKNTLRLKGMATTYPDMAKFMQTFNSDEMLGDPVLISAESDGTLPVTRFEMIAKFKGL